MSTLSNVSMPRHLNTDPWLRKAGFPKTKFKQASHKGCTTFLEALLFMIEKEDLREQAEPDPEPLSLSAMRPISRARTASPVEREASPV